jgi:uncharacterized protein YjbI with pentapeptide repeats
MSDMSMRPSMSLKDDVSDAHDDVTETSSAPNASLSGVDSSRYSVYRERLHSGALTWSFAVVGTTIAVFSISWIAYGVRKSVPDSNALLGVSAAVLAALVLRLSYLTIRSQSAVPDSTARLAEAEHIGSATKNLGARSSPGRLGALYVLERVGIQSRESAASVLNSLLSFIRRETAVNLNIRRVRRAPKISDDVQTALAILGRLRTLGQLPLSLRIDLSWCDLSGARLRDWDFSGVDLHHAILNDADLSNSNFDNSNLPYCSFMRARIVGTSFRWAILFQADFTDALMINADLSNAMMASSKLQRIQMHYCTLRHSMLQNAQIIDAHMIDVDLRGASTSGATVVGSEIITRDSDQVIIGSGLKLMTDPNVDAGN